jgi:hypothetical protein
MFAKSKQVGLVSLFVVLATALGGCAESVSGTPASFPGEQRQVAFLSRTAPVPMVRDEESLMGSRVSSLPPRADAKHFARALARR